jgi:DNA polymerase eta
MSCAASFYCQVEQKRLGIDAATPCAVQQWSGLIAVNYAARAAGVRRGDRADAARRKCPAIRLVHVETIGDDGDAEGATASGANDDGDAKRSDAPDRTRSKVVA